MTISIYFSYLHVVFTAKINPKFHIRKPEILGGIGTCRKTFLDFYKLFLYLGGVGELLYLLFEDSELGNICRFLFFSYNY